MLRGTVVDDTFDYCSLNVKHCWSLGMPFEPAIEEAIAFVRDELPGSTDLCEQAHGSGAILTKHHELYSEIKLRAASVLHQSRSLFQAANPDPLATALRAELTILQQRQTRTAYQV